VLEMATPYLFLS